MMTIHINKTKSIAIGALLCIAGMFNACKTNIPLNPSITKPTTAFIALTNSTATIPSQLIRYTANNVNSAASAAITITGLQTGESIVAIDYRPATGQLYGLGSTSRVYQIPVPVSVTATTTAARAISATPFTPALTGPVADFDFNPTVDRIRVTTTGGQNLRINPEDGTVVSVDAPLNSTNAAAPVVSASAYTNNVSGAATTTLYDLDLTNRKLYKQDPPNAGTLVDVGITGIPVPTATGTPATVPAINAGLDIGPDGTALAVATIAANTASSLYQIDLETGIASELGVLAIPNSLTGNNTIIGTSIIDIAIPTAPVAYAVDDANSLYIFNTASPSTAVTKPITGLQTGETIYGIDFRPLNGQLYALGSTSRLYTINLGTGAATAVGAAPFLTALNGASFGFDFNPQADRIRIVSNTGQNLVADPALGTVTVSPNVSVTGGTPTVTASAYSNNTAGATATVLFSIDSSTDKLYRQDPATGVLTLVGALGIDVDAANGFDIGIAGTTANATPFAATGNGVGIFTVGTTTRLYNISLVSGVATTGLEFPKKVRGFALGLGF